MKTPKVVLLIETSRGFGRNLLRGIAKYVSIHTPWVFYQEIPNYINFFENKINLEKIKKWKPDGIIMREIRNMDEIIEIGVPTIVSTYSKEIIPKAANMLPAAIEPRRTLIPQVLVWGWLVKTTLLIGQLEISSSGLFEVSVNTTE